MASIIIQHTALQQGYFLPSVASVGVREVTENNGDGVTVGVEVGANKNKEYKYFVISNLNYKNSVAFNYNL